MTSAALAARRSHTIVDSPIGPLTLVAAGPDLAGVYLSEHRHAPAPEVFGAREPGPLAEAARQLGEYFAGGRTEFTLELTLDGTAFQQRVWTQLQAISYGQTISYGELARRIGQPAASRAVGLANGRNPVSIIVPCHRVVGADGRLTGYGGGLARKQYLLGLEQRVSGRIIV
jgi:methylated-DNA-[protein]-cysteine S-methyltransferase